MKQLLITLILLLYINTELLSQNDFKSNDKNLIFWSNKNQLTWKDFKYKYIFLGEKKALSIIGLKFIPVFISDTKGKMKVKKMYKLEVLPFFNKKNSITTDINSELLKHEQYHFNIAELIARRIRKYIANRNYKEIKLKEYYRIINKFKLELNTYQLKYDIATKHGRNKRNQVKWENKVSLELKKIEKYKISILPHKLHME